MGAPRNATTNAALSTNKVEYYPDAQSIISQKYGDLQSAFISILKNQLAPKVDNGKTIYWGIATKILDATATNYSSYDFFRRPNYDIERLDGTSDSADLSAKKIVMAHIPGLFTTTSVYDDEENKLENKFTPADIFKLPIETSLKIRRGDIIEIIFDSPNDFTNPKIISAIEKNDRRLKITSKRKDGISPKKAMADFAKCKLLQVKEPTGAALDNKMLLNPKAPSTGHLGTYVRAAQNYLPATNLLPNIVRIMGKQGYLQTLKQPGQIDSIGTNEIQSATDQKNLNIRFSFLTSDSKIGNRVNSRLAFPELKSLTSFTELIPFDVNSNMFNTQQGGFQSLVDGKNSDGDDKMNRSVYLLVEVFPVNEDSIFKANQEEKFLSAALTYLKNLFVQTFKYGVKEYTITTSEASSNGYATNQAGSTSRFIQLDMMENVKAAATPKEALDFDDLAYNKNFPQDEAGFIAISPVIQPISGATAPQGASIGSQTIALKSPLDECEDAEKLLDELYIKAKGTQALKYANQRIRKLHKFYKQIHNNKKKYDFVPPSIMPGTEGLGALNLLNSYSEFVLSMDLIDYFSRNRRRMSWGRTTTSRPSRSRFIYTSKSEEIAFPSELIKKQKKKPKGKKKKAPPLPPRGTNRDIMMSKSTILAKFYEELKKLIAGNETTAKNRIIPDQIVIVPLKVFRPYQIYTARRPYHDRNSRHFYNRAFDFSVFIVNNKNAVEMAELQEIPSENVYQIPSDVVYLYVTRLIQLTSGIFEGGLALFTRGSNKNFQYNHYEYMYDVPNSVEVVKKRRWCNPPKTKADKKALVGQLFSRPDDSKDNIVKNWVSNNYSSEIIGAAPQKIQFLIG